MKYRCKHRRLGDRWRDMRLEGSKLDGVVDADALDEGRKLGLFEDVVEGSDLGGEENLPSLPRVATAPPVAPQVELPENRKGEDCA